MNPVEFESWLRSRSGQPLELVVTDNRVLWLSLKRRAGGPTILRLHRRFLSAPSAVREALAGWVGGQRAQHRGVIRDFIRQQSEPAQMELPLPTAAPRRLCLRSRGRFFDLAELRDAVNREYFGGRLTCAITWGRCPARAARRHLTFGTYSSAHNLVRIHPRLDATDVPRFFVEFVVFHEMLHAALGQQQSPAGRRVVHSRQFRIEERKFARYAEAMVWEKQNLGRLLHRC